VRDHFDMATWLSHVRSEICFLSENNAPACGTVGCFAGWVELLMIGNRRRVITTVERTGSVFAFADAGEVVSQMLGPKISALLSDNNMFTFSPMSKDGCVFLDRGTKEYAAAADAHIRRFMKKYERVLRRRMLQPGDAWKALQTLRGRV
jgi:hypothetical protein